MIREEAIDIIKCLAWHSRPDEEDIEQAIKTLEQEPCEDCISREALRRKLQEHHDFWVNAYGSYKDMPLKEKTRVDEISNCIAVVVNAPSVTPQPMTGHWMHPYKSDIACECSECHIQMPITKDFNYCPNCGCWMKGESE